MTYPRSVSVKPRKILFLLLALASCAGSKAATPIAFTASPERISPALNEDGVVAKRNYSAIADIEAVSPHPSSVRDSARGLDLAKREVPMAPKTLDAKLQSMVDKAFADLIDHLKPRIITADDIELMRAERVTWRSGAMGCPLPDRAYLMVLTPGVRIVLRTSDTEYEYHGSPGGTPFLCKSPATIETPVSGSGAVDLT